MLEQSIIALGANLDDPVEQLKSAIESLRNTKCIKVIKCSGIYQSKPQGPPQPDYFNQAVLIETSLSPHQLLAELQNIEDRHGRIRHQRWGPRTLDLDIIVYGDLVLNDEKLTLPHPRAHQRSFVLKPMAEIVPQTIIPGYGTVESLCTVNEDHLVYQRLQDG